jgi:hypothetical protein
MSVSNHSNLYLTSLAVLAILAVPTTAIAARKNSMSMPDFTKGESIPEGAKHDWTLGATGARGWIYSEKLVTSDARQIYITKIEKGAPAQEVLAVGDVILGVGGKAFSLDPRTEFGKALTTAESEAGGGKLALTRWRAGKSSEVVVKLPVLGSYSVTAPYDCPKSKRIFEQGCKALAAKTALPNSRQNPITRSLNALALLASGNPEYLPLVKKEAQWAADYSAEGFQTWYYGYVITLLAEYKMATGDESVMPGLRRLALEAANGQSAVGSWGHKFAQPDGRLSGYGMMNAPGVPLTISLTLARAAGLKEPAIDKAIERSARLLRFYIGKGAIPYGDHQPWTQTHEDNGKCGMASVMFNLLDEPKGAEFFSRMSLASHGPERDGGHTGNFWNIMWSLPAVAQSGPNATGAWMREFGAWYFDLARCQDGTFIHQGPPEMGNDSTAGWDATGAYLLAYAMPLKKIHLTGRRPPATPQLSAAAAEALIRDGRGWSNKDRNSAYDKLDRDQLFKCLGSWSPAVRERAAMALARRKGDSVVPTLVELLESPQMNDRYGACLSLAMLKGASAPAVPALRKLLQHEDLWLRVQAAEALAAIGEPAMSALPVLLERLARAPSAEDPRGMEQRFLCSSVFGKMLKNSLEGVDQGLVRKAVVAGLQNEDGKARGAVGSIYQKLSYEEVKPLLPAIHQAIVKPAPSGEMFASNIRLLGLELLAKHRIREGMELCLDVMEINNWGKADRIGRCLKTLGIYGAAAKPLLPRLRQLEKDLLAQGESKNLQPRIVDLRSLIKATESATGTVELRELE